jgi:hypothetical protein
MTDRGIFRTTIAIENLLVPGTGQSLEPRDPAA